MATQRLTMKNIREILRQKWALQRSHRDVAASLDVSAGVVGKVVGQASEAGLTWDAVQALSDQALERVVYDGEPASRARPLPDFTHIHAQRRRKGVTLALLHVEYLEKNRDGYRYTQFCELYRTWLKRRGWTMRIDHVAGDKVTGPTGTGKSFRFGERSTILTSQRPPELWHDQIGDPTTADAICDRMLSQCHRLMLKGPSRRKEVPSQT